MMLGPNSIQEALEKRWMRDKVWSRSLFVREFLVRARGQFPTPQNGNRAAWPEDEEGIGQNLTYLFTGHLLKISKILCSVLGDEESIRYLSQTGELTVIDMACGAGMASVGIIDFLNQAIKAGIVRRQTPLTVSFVLNDLNEPCVIAAKNALEIVRRILGVGNRQMQIGSVSAYTGSVSGIIPFIEETDSRPFDLLFFCNAFDHVLMYAHKALEKDPNCSDPIAHARPCDRPAFLAGLLQGLGAYANPMFSRSVLMQESRHCHLISVALPDRNLRVTHTWMTQETDPPDVSTPTMNVRFAYCGCRYGFPTMTLSATQEMLPLSSKQSSNTRYSDAATPIVFFDDM
ncbi:MAG TPA: hypothetical protein VM492_07005 [Sumerlaeia bacterium]|nr:hypothetical protein [Sumerlaeia bacterium]